MGNEESAPPPPPKPLPITSPNFPYFMIDFAGWKFISVISADTTTIGIIKRACTNAWPNGVKETKYNEDGSYHIEFYGKPFATVPDSYEEFYMGKVVATRILTDLYSAGWDFVLSSDLCRISDRASWFFQRCAETERPMPKIFCFYPASKNEICLVGAEPSLRETMKYAVQKVYGYGVKDEESYPYPGNCHQMTFKGELWWITKDTSASNTLLGERRLMLEIVRQIHYQQYRLYANGNIQGTKDCLFFIHDPDQVDPRQENLFAISLYGAGSLILIDHPSDLEPLTRQVIKKYWGQIEVEDTLSSLASNGYECLLKGKPWWLSGGRTIESRNMLTQLFRELLKKGWSILATLDISREERNKAFFIMRSCQPVDAPHFCIIPNAYNSLIAVGARPEMMHLIHKDVTSVWPLKDQPVSDQLPTTGQVWINYKVIGEPWRPQILSEGYWALVMMCRILHTLHRRGWRVISSADVAASGFREGKFDCGFDVHTWIVAYTGVVPMQTTAIAPNAPPISRLDSDDSPPTFDQLTIIPDAPPMVRSDSDDDAPPPSYDEAVGGLRYE